MSKIKLLNLLLLSLVLASSSFATEYEPGWVKFIKLGNLKSITQVLQSDFYFGLMWKRDAFGGTPLHIAAGHGLTDVVELLLENKANVNALDKFGRTALIDALNSGKIELVSLLLANGCQVEIACRDGRTALHIAVLHDLKEVVKLLLENKANIEARDNRGSTPLHIAVEHNQEQMVKLL